MSSQQSSTVRVALYWSGMGDGMGGEDVEKGVGMMGGKTFSVGDDSDQLN